MRSIFWNAAEHRLRAGWRVLVQILLVALPLGTLGAFGYFASPGPMETRVASVALPITLLSVFIAGRYIDKRRFSDFGLLLGQKTWWADYGVGFLVGLAAATAYVVLLVLLGWAEVSTAQAPRGDSASVLAAFLMSFLTYVAVGVFEELMRAYQIRNVTEGLAHTRLRLVGATLVAISLSGAWSMVAHLAGGDPAFLFFVFCSSLVYGLSFAWTKRIALAMALHFAWDFTLSSVFLLGEPGVYDASLFVVDLSGVADSDALRILGVVPKILALVLIARWVKVREGGVRVRGELASPSLVARASDAA